jgi:hypothetical protein
MVFFFDQTNGYVLAERNHTTVDMLENFGWATPSFHGKPSYTFL